MRVRPGIEVPDRAVQEICTRFHVRELSLFGSSARGDFRSESDIDLLVDFERDAPVGLIEFSALQRALTDLLGAKVDLVSKRGLNPVIRAAVLGEARVLLAA